VSDERPVKASSRLRGGVRVPGDKSTSHRALLISALANGESVIEGLSTGADVRSTALIITQLGAQLKEQGDLVHVLGPATDFAPVRRRSTAATRVPRCDSSRAS